MTVVRADASRAAVHGAGRQTLPVFVFVWSATQAEARNAPAGLSVVNSHRGRLQMPLQKAATLRDLCPARGAGPVWVSSASLSIAVIVTLAEAPVRLAIEHSTSWRFLREVRIPNLCRDLPFGDALGPDLPPPRSR